MKDNLEENNDFKKSCTSDRPPPPKKQSNTLKQLKVLKSFYSSIRMDVRTCHNQTISIQNHLFPLHSKTNKNKRQFCHERQKS